MFNISSVLILFLLTFNVCLCAPTENQDLSLADNYNALAEDVKWLLNGVSKLSGTLEQLLPNVTTGEATNQSFSEETRINFLVGVRHLLLGVREIAITFEHSFKTDHVKHFHQLKHITIYANQLLSIVKMWFNQLRALAAYILTLYNRHIPEMLFGQCLGIYLTKTYPQNSYYEYPFLLLKEIYLSIATGSDDPNDSTEIATAIVPTFDSAIINAGAESPMQTDANSQSFFDLSTVLDENKDKIIENAVTQHSWQICLKLYTAESIARSLKSYFLGL